MNHFCKRGISVLLAILMLASSMFSCSETPAEETESTPAETSAAPGETAAEETETEYSILNTLPEFSFEGATITALSMLNSWWQTITLAAEEMNGETLNDAIFDRNAAFMQQYDVDFKVIEDDSITSLVRAAVTAGDPVYDFAMPRLDSGITLVNEDLIINLNNVGTVDFTNDAWDKNGVKFYSVAGKLYYGVSDISLAKNETAWIYMFNKKLIAEYQQDNPYELVREGKWTFDKSLEMMAVASADTNGNGTPDEGDRFGLATHAGNYYALLVGGGQPFAIKDEAADLPVINAETEGFLNVYDKIKDDFTDKSQTVMEWEGETFKAGNALLCAQVLACVRLFREMEDDFGIIPIPKFSEEQQNYCSYIIPTAICAAVIPVSAADAERSGMAMQALTILSAHHLTPAYYDTVITGKGLRDMDSWEMLDLILESGVYDLGLLYNWGGFTNTMNSNLENKRELASTYKRKARAIRTDLEETIETIKTNKN